MEAYREIITGQMLQEKGMVCNMEDGVILSGQGDLVKKPELGGLCLCWGI